MVIFFAWFTVLIKLNLAVFKMGQTALSSQFTSP